MRNGVLIALLGTMGAFGGEKEIVVDLGGGTSLKLVRVPAGAFLMGNPRAKEPRARGGGTQQKVTITRDFFMGACEITRGQFAAFVKDAGYAAEPEKNGWAFA